MSKWIKNRRGRFLIFNLYIWSRNNMNVNGSFNAGFVQYTLLTWYKCSVYFCKTEIVISIWQHFRSEERQTFKNVQNQFIFKNSLLTKYFWYKLVQFFVKSRLSILKSSKDSLEWVANTTAALMNGPIFETCNSNSNTSNHSRCAHIRLQLALSYTWLNIALKGERNLN